MPENRFEIVFQHLAEAQVELTQAPTVIAMEISTGELRDIDELRRLAFEIREPGGVLFTTT